MSKQLIKIQRARRERFDGMSNANFYARFINTGRLKTTTIGRNRYTTDEWVDECIGSLGDADVKKGAAAERGAQ